MLFLSPPGPLASGVETMDSGLLSRNLEVTVFRLGEESSLVVAFGERSALPPSVPNLDSATLCRRASLKD